MTPHQKSISVSYLPASDLFNIDTWVGDFYITRTRRLVGALELGGVDTSCFTFEDHLKLSRVVDVIFGNIGAEFTVTQYQINSKSGRVVLKDRDDPLQHRISKEREDLLAKTPFIETRIIHFIEIALDNSFNSLNPFTLLADLAGSVVSKQKRSALIRALSTRKQIEVARADLNDKIDLLNTCLRDVSLRWSLLGGANQIRRADMLQILSFLGSCRSATFANAGPEEEAVDQFLGQGDIKPVSLSGVPVIKFLADTPTYARIGAITTFGKRAAPGFWAQGSAGISLMGSQFVIMYRWKALSSVQTSMMFTLKRKELERKTINLANLIAGQGATSPAHLSKKLLDQFSELDEADAMRVSWSKAESYVLVYGGDIQSIKKVSADINTKLTGAGASVVWEDTNLMNAYRAFFPAGAGRGARKLITNSNQDAAFALCYKTSTGTPVVEPSGEEALCVFHTPTGNAFHYHPRIGGRGLVLGFGPTRTGKTYFKNTVAMHSLKYGGMYYALDVDAGTEPLAGILGSNGSVFRVYDEREGSGGFNLFTSCRGPNDLAFKAHFIQQIRRMLATNMSQSERELSADEQREIDSALESTLALPEEMRSMSFFYTHLNRSLAHKLIRWVRGDAGQKRADGIYAQLTDTEKDSVGVSTQFKVFNFQNLKNDADQRGVAYAEVFHRIIQDFESAALRGIPKFFDVDEAHIPLQDPHFQQWFTQGVVTWNKYHVIPSLWTQSVEEMTKLERFEAIRSAASTMIFTHDHDLNEELYQSRLGLTAGECAAIRALIPKRQIYIIQREIGVSRTLDVHNDPFTDMLVNSTPEIAAIRDPLIAEHGTERGVSLAVESVKSSPN